MSGAVAVIWDWNGTLLDDVEVSLEIVNELLAENEVPPLTQHRYRDIFEIPAQRYWERAGLDLERVGFEQISLAFCRRFEERLHRARLFPGVQELLGALRARGMRQLMLSGTEQVALQRMLRRYGLEDEFDAVHGMSDTLARGKLEVGQNVVAGSGLDPAEMVIVGDTVHDAEVARSLGTQCALLATGHQSRARLEGCGAPVFDSWERLARDWQWS